MKINVRSRSVRALGVLGVAAGVLAATTGAAQAATYAKIQNGCWGRLFIQSQWDGTAWHDYAQGQFQNLTNTTGWTGWTCKFTLQRSTDGGHTFHDISGVHNGDGEQDATYFYYDGPNTSGGPNYEARVCIMATNPLGNWTNIDYTDPY